MRNIYTVESTKKWIPTIATLNKVELKHSDNDSDGTFSEKIDLEYRYNINEKMISGNKLAIGYTLNNIENHSELFYKLQNASKILVYYNPNDISESYAILGYNNSIIGLLIFTIMWNSVFIFFIFNFIFPQKQTKKISIFILITIWISGFIILLNKESLFNIQNKLIVIEKKSND